MQGKTLVAYFSAEGTTKRVAEAIAETLGADIFEIKPEIPYSSRDLNWMDKRSRSSVEMNDPSSRPAMKEDIDISAYDNILLGFPIWWYVEPHIVDTFLEGHDFAGKTLIPFATSGGSGIEGAVEHIKSICPKADIQKGKRLSLGATTSWARSL